MRRRSWRLPLVLVAALLTACSYSGEQDPFLVMAGPGEVCRLEVTDEQGGTLWKLEAQPPQRLDEVFYAAPPEGFRQIEPVPGRAPRSLLPGEIVRVETVTRRRRFVHWGVARGAANVEILNYSMELLSDDGLADLTNP